MEKPTKAVLAAAAIGATVIILYLAGFHVGLASPSSVPSPSPVSGTPWHCRGLLAPRLLYPFSHANIFHALGNAYCLLIVTRAYRMSVAALLAAYTIAVTVPPFTLSATPVMGLSGMCFALMGLAFWRVRRKLYYNAWALAFIAVTGIFAHIAALLHLWCLLAGEAIGFLNAPAPWNRK